MPAAESGSRGLDERLTGDKADANIRLLMRFSTTDEPQCLVLTNSEAYAG